MWKRRLSKHFLFLLCFCLLGVQAQTELLFSQTTHSSGSNEKSLNSSNARLMIWNDLSQAFYTTLETQEELLKTLSQQLLTSEQSLEQSTILLDRLSKLNTDLMRYNEQIAQRMQQRDEELYFAYLELGEQDKAIEDLKARVIMWMRSTLTIAAVVLGFLLVKHGLPFAMRLIRGF